MSGVEEAKKSDHINQDTGCTVQNGVCLPIRQGESAPVGVAYDCDSTSEGEFDDDAAAEGV